MIVVGCVDGLPFFTCVIRFVWRTWRCWVRMWLWTTSFTWTVPTCCLTNPSTNRSQSHESSCNIVWSKKKKKQPFIWTQLKTQTVPERERERAVKEKRKKEQNNVFFTYFNSFELVFSPAWLHRPSIRNDEHMICKKKQPSPPDRFITLVSWIWWMINVSALMERRWRAGLIYLGWLSVRRWRV